MRQVPAPRQGGTSLVKQRVILTSSTYTYRIEGGEEIEGEDGSLLGTYPELRSVYLGYGSVVGLWSCIRSVS